MIILLVIIDQISKYYAIQNIPYLKNTGAAWGILNNLPSILILISVIVIFFSIRNFYYHPFAFSFLIGGILGNLYDRIIRGFVVDFINIHLFNYPWFNFADSFITIAIALIIFKMSKE